MKLDRAQVFLEAILDWALLFEKDLEKWRKKKLSNPHKNHEPTHHLLSFSQILGNIKRTAVFYTSFVFKVCKKKVRYCKRVRKEISIYSFTLKQFYSGKIKTMLAVWSLIRGIFIHETFPEFLEPYVDFDMTIFSFHFAAEVYFLAESE